MRKVLTALLLLLAPAAARADGPDALQCRNLKPRPGDAADEKVQHQTRDCFEGNVFVLDGRPFQTVTSSSFACTTDADCVENFAKGIPAKLKCDTKIGKCAKQMILCSDGQMDPKAPLGCKQWNYNDLGGAAITRLLEILDPQGKGKNFGTNKWDQIVLWDADFETKSGMIFQRFQGKNWVDGLGNISRSTAPPLGDIPALGWVLAGSTAHVDEPIDEVFPCPSGAACRFTPGLYGALDALAQSVGQMFTGHAEIDVTGLPAASKFKSSSLQNESSAPPRIWSSFADVKGSLQGGNNWRDEGNDTFAIAYPPPISGVIPPFDGQLKLSFAPLDLYFMGLASSDEIPDVRIFANPPDADIVLPKFDQRPGWFGSGMGIVPGVTIRAGADSIITVDKKRILDGSGERDPGFANAPHAFRQLWVIVTLPDTTPEKEIMKGPKTTVPGGVEKVIEWRRIFNWYFYMLTHWKGRMITSYEGDVDENPYWEFGQQDDDRKAFSADGVTLPADPIKDGILTISTPGSGGSLTFNPGATGGLKLRIDPTHFNAATVRMRIAPGSLAPGQAHASISFPNGPTVMIPGHANATLIPDGLWHTYSANLSEIKAWTEGGSYDSFTLVPSDKPVDRIEIDFVRIYGTENPGDTDKECGSTIIARPDGWVDDFDNCSGLYNPGQEDGNGDGVGDACEDFDGDTISNLCDNCPTLTNSRQRDRNGNDIGDVCDGDQGQGCCFAPESSFGGRVQVNPGLFVGGLALFGAALVATRRRRR